MNRSTGQKMELAIRRAAALILAKRYKSIGVPLSKIRRILSKQRIPIDVGLMELQRRFKAVGLLLKEIEEMIGGKKYRRLIAIIDPELDVKEIKPYDDETLTILAVIYSKAYSSEISIEDLKVELRNLLNLDEKEISSMLRRVLRKLLRDSIISMTPKRGLIRITEFGKAIMPPKEQIDRLILDVLYLGPEAEEDKNGSKL
ncbi:MAG: hypothetical protein ACTSU6_06605 [Candidatus Njordarchaeales archaeon]